MILRIFAGLFAAWLTCTLLGATTLVVLHECEMITHDFAGTIAKVWFAIPVLIVGIGSVSFGLFSLIYYAITGEEFQ